MGVGGIVPTAASFTLTTAQRAAALAAAPGYVGSGLLGGVLGGLVLGRLGVIMGSSLGLLANYARTHVKR
jgi:predicted lipid-binding transport protein (Tim44 family)